MKTVLTIAGSDSCSGAGIQADLKTMAAFGIYATTAITALTAQNTTGVFAIQETTPACMAQQLECIFTDIFPDAVKIGMVYSTALIQVIADKLMFYHPPHIVLDPILASTTGTSLLDADAERMLQEKLFPLAEVLTPNVPECEKLLHMQIQKKSDMEYAVKALGDRYNCAVIGKGGHFHADADDLLYDKGNLYWFYGKQIHNPNNHGTGCTYSSAIASGLAKGLTLPESVHTAKEYMNGALHSNLNLGCGSGPLNHFWNGVNVGHCKNSFI